MGAGIVIRADALGPNVMSGTVLIHRFRSPFAVTYRLLAGNSLVRALFNLSLKGHEIRGDVLDLGSKSPAASYFAFLQTAPGTRVVFTDIHPNSGLVTLDVEERFNVPSESYDTVLAFHLFEHVFHFQRAPAEVFRVLRPGGRILVSVPFLHEYHADPGDYVRLTDTGLKRLWESVGFRCTHMEAIGEGLLTSAFTKIATQIFPRVLRTTATVLAYLVSTPLDRLIALRPRIDGRSVPERFALEFLGVFEKPRAN
jgi:SAM-dependent methyltransferase